MNRRGFLKCAGWIGMAKALVPAAWAAAPPADGPVQKAIVLYCDLAVDPTREQEMLHHFHHEF